MYASIILFRYPYLIYFLLDEKIRQNTPLCNKELLITGSEFSLSGFFLAVVCSVKPWEQSREKNWSQKIPYIALYYAPCVDNSD